MPHLGKTSLVARTYISGMESSAPLHPAHLWAGLRPCSLEELDGAKLMDRLDQKYLVPQDLMSELVAALASGNDTRDANDAGVPGYRVLEIGGTRRHLYRTLYLDDAAFSFHQAHQCGRLPRAKVRLRTYATTGACFLEHKRKGIDGGTRKRRLLRAEPAPTLDATTQLSPAEREFLAAKGVATEPLRPVLAMEFLRTTLLAPSGRERITFDTELRYGLPGETLQLLEGVVILEIKHERGAATGPLQLALRRLGLRPLSWSKYCTSLALRRPDLRSNRFKPSLLQWRSLLRAQERMITP